MNFNLSGADSDNDPLEFVITQAPAHGTLVVAVLTGAAIYSPAAGYCGPDSFKFNQAGAVKPPANLGDRLVVNNGVPLLMLRIARYRACAPIRPPEPAMRDTFAYDSNAGNSQEASGR